MTASAGISAALAATVEGEPLPSGRPAESGASPASGSAPDQCDAQTIMGRCFDLAIMQVQGDCRHEHVRVRNLCDWHGHDMLSDNSHGVCGPCHDAGHDCSLSARLIGYTR